MTELTESIGPKMVLNWKICKKKNRRICTVFKENLKKEVQTEGVIFV